MTEPKSIYTRMAEANVLPDGLLTDISYGDYAFMMVAKDNPVPSKHSHKHQDTTHLK